MASAVAHYHTRTDYPSPPLLAEAAPTAITPRRDWRPRSHGLDQRQAGTVVTAQGGAGFTNFTQDPPRPITRDFRRLLTQGRLFLARAAGRRYAVINNDDAKGVIMVAIARALGMRTITGWASTVAI